MRLGKNIKNILEIRRNIFFSLIVMLLGRITSGEGGVTFWGKKSRFKNEIGEEYTVVGNYNTPLKSVAVSIFCWLLSQTVRK